MASNLVANGHGAHASTAEDVDSALREADNVNMAIGEGTFVESNLGTLRSLTAAGSAPTVGAVLYKTTGVGRTDLVIARFVYRSVAGGQQARASLRPVGDDENRGQWDDAAPVLGKLIVMVDDQGDDVFPGQ